ncbi:hypothetical protein CYY_007335, partial [Polysphondylium violaceum]
MVDKNKTTVLDEDQYVSKLSEIIERDYFPDLPKLRNQLEWMEAVESNDVNKIRNIQLNSMKRLTSVHRNQLNTPNINSNNESSFETPNISNNRNSFDTPNIHNLNNNNNNSNSNSNNNTIQQQQQKQENKQNISLDQFVNNYISEDDNSFKEIQEKNIKQLNHKYKWLIDKANKQNQLLLESSGNSNGKQQLLLKGTESENDSNTNDDKSDDKDLSIVNNSNSNKPIGPNTWNYTIKNQLMFYPSANESNHQIIGGPPKEIIRDNTRITQDPWKDIKPKNVEKKSKPSKPFNEMTLQEQIEHLKDMENEGKSTMDIESSILGYVSTPTLMTPRGDESPFMTWGKVEGTPLLLPDNPMSTPLNMSMSSRPSFKIPDTPQRELMANILTDKIKKTSTNHSINTPKTPKTPTTPKGPNTPKVSSLASLSPAAQKLLVARGHTPNPRAP